jgi:hypothetical protein
MKFRTDSKAGPPVRALADLVADIRQTVDTRQQQWLQQLAANPAHFVAIEVQVHEAFQQLADQLVAGLLAEAAQQPQLAEDAKKKSSTR